jgi:hypothetical protein
MGLTAKQEKFSQSVADGMSFAEAYRLAYNAEKMNRQTINVKASELAATKVISDRVAELRSKLEKKALWTREMSVKALISAYQEGKPSDKINAVKELNNMHGFNAPQKLDIKADIAVSAIDVSKLSTDVLKQIIEAKNGSD